MAADLTFVSFSGTSNPTAFSIYDSDGEFQGDADKIIYFVMRNLGSPVLDSEIDLRQIWTAFEQATIEYSQGINSHHACNVLIDLLGTSTGSLSGSENIFTMGNTTDLARKFTIQYSSEIGAGSEGIPWLTSSIALSAGVAKYDLWGPLSGTLTGANANKSITIRKIHHYEPFAAYRFFDTTSVLNFMANEMNFASYSPETIFYLLPIWEDILRGTQLKLNQRVRRSNYSFDLQGFQLTLYPVPTKADQLFFEYSYSPKSVDGTDTHGHKAFGMVSNISNVAFGHIGYSSINSVGKTWIYKMTLAMCKEILGQIRDKYKSIPIPGSEVSLNGADLVAQGREEQANLRLELKELLDQLSYKNLTQERTEMEESLLQQWKRVPTFIYTF